MSNSEPAPTKPRAPSCGDGCACLTQCGDYYVSHGLPIPPERAMKVSALIELLQAMPPDAVVVYAPPTRVMVQFEIGRAYRWLAPI